MITIKILNLIGKIDIESEFKKVFSKEGFLVTPEISDSVPFEMTGESMYYALNELEHNKNSSEKQKKRKIVDAIIRRKEYCGGTISHKSLNGGNDTQLRATSAVLRTLLGAEKDEIYFKNDFNDIFEHHFSYYFNWNKGIWFCHDTSEKVGKTPISHIKTKAFGKEKRNTVTLNTHLDSLTTLLLVLREKESYNNKANVDLAKKAIHSVNKLLKVNANQSLINFLLQKIDNFLFKYYLKRIDKENFFWKVYQKIIHPLCFKLISPTIFFKNGFIGRDLSVMNIHVDYLLVNVTDFLRLLVIYESTPLSLKKKLDIELNKKDLLKHLKNAIKLVHNNDDIKLYINNNNLQKAWYAECIYLFSFFDNEFEGSKMEIMNSRLYNLETTIFAHLYLKYKNG